MENIVSKADMLMDDLSKAGSVGDVQRIFATWPSDWLTGCNKENESRIRRRFISFKKEIELSFKDPDYMEAYGFFSVPVKKTILGFLENILQTKRLRKRRSTKISTKKLRFCSTGDPNLKSLPFVTNPDKIVGARAVLVWIPKRKMAVWISAKDSSGLAVLGNRIVRFDSQTSFAKTVRKPEELVLMLSNSGSMSEAKKVYSYLKSIKTVEYEIDGKMNKKYIIVKIW